MVDSIFTVTYLYIDFFLKIVAMEMGAYSTIVCSPETFAKNSGWEETLLKSRLYQERVIWGVGPCFYKL